MIWALVIWLVILTIWGLNIQYRFLSTDIRIDSDRKESREKLKENWDGLKAQIGRLETEMQNNLSRLRDGYDNESRAWALEDEYEALGGDGNISWNTYKNKFNFRDPAISVWTTSIGTDSAYYYNGSSGEKSIEEVEKILQGMKAKKYDSCKKKGKCK